MKNKILFTVMILLSLKSFSQSLMKGEASDSTERFFFYGVSSINTTEELGSSLTGTQKFAIGAIIKKIEINDSSCLQGLKIDLAVNALNLRPTGVSKDSLDLVSLMFPETGNSGFMLNPKWLMFNRINGNNTHRFGLEASFSLRQTKINDVAIRDSAGDITGSESISFSAINWNLMPYYSYKYKRDDFDAFISFGLPFNLFIVPEEDVKNFTKLFPDDDPFKENAVARIFSLGGKVTVGINGFLFYADIRQSSKTKNFKDDNPFKGFVFNVGFASVLTVFKK